MALSLQVLEPNLGDGDLYTFGRSRYGALGVSKNSDLAQNEKHIAPVKVKHLSDQGIKITKVALGVDHSIAIGSEGEVYTWGQGRRGSSWIYRMLWPSKHFVMSD